MKKLPSFLVVLLLLFSVSSGYGGGLSPDILNEPCNSITAWTDADTGTAVSTLDGNTFKFDTGGTAAAGTYARRYKNTNLAVPSLSTIEIKAYFSAIGTLASVNYFWLRYSTATWRFQVAFATDGLFIYKTGAGTTEVGADIVPSGDSVYHVWRFQINKSAGEDAATVEVFLDGVSQGTVDCDYEVASSNSIIDLYQRANTTSDRLSYIDYIRIATGLGEINDADIIQAGAL